jgi:hypothetical protein
MRVFQAVISSDDLPVFLADSGLLPYCDVEEDGGTARYIVREAYGPPVKTNRSTSDVVQYAMVGFDVVAIDDGRCQVAMFINTSFSALSVLAGPMVFGGFLTYFLVLGLQAPKWHVENVVVGGIIVAVFLAGLVLTSAVLVKVVGWMRRTRRGLVFAEQQRHKRA